MANYTVKDDQGMQVTFEWNGDAPPTDADMDGIFTEARDSKPGMVESAVRTAGAVLGGIPAGITSGYYGLYDLGKNLVQGKGMDQALQSATETIETTGVVPQQILNTPEQQEAAQKIGETIAWPMEKAGEGLQEIVKQTPLEGTIAEPIANVGGQMAAILAGGKVASKPLGGLARAIEQKRIAPMRQAQRAAGLDVPIKADISGVPPPPSPVAGEFAAMFGGEKPEAMAAGKKAAPVPDEPPLKFLMDEQEKAGRIGEGVAPELESMRQANKTPEWLEVVENKENLNNPAFMRKGDIGVLSETLTPEEAMMTDTLRNMKMKDPSSVMNATVESERALQQKMFEGKTAPVGLEDLNPDLAAKMDRYLAGKERGSVTLGMNPIPQMMEAWTKYIGTPIWDYAWEKALPKVLEKTGRPGKAILRAMDPDYRGDLQGAPKYNALLEETKTAQAVGREYAIDLGNRLQRLAEADQMKVGEYLRGEQGGLPDNIRSIGDEAKNTLINLGKQAVDTGLLGEEVFFRNIGKYMPRLYSSKEYPTLLQKWGEPKPTRLDLDRFQKRKDIPAEIRKEMGEILTPGYPVAKGIIQLTHDISMAKMFQGIAGKPEWFRYGNAPEIPQGWVKLPESSKLGAVKGGYVHPEIGMEINATLKVREEWKKVASKAYGVWKYGKVIASPKTHMRNMMSNSILTHLGGLPMYEQPLYLARAIKEMSSKGPAYMAVRQNSNIFRTGWAQAELRSLYDASVSLEGIPAGSFMDTMPILRDALAKGKKVGAKMADLYQKEEQVFKMAKVLKSLDQGMDIRAAVTDANKWLFDYSKVTRFQEKYRQSLLGAPFATFTIKALPRVFEAAVKTPWRFALPFAMTYGLEEWARNTIGDTEEQAEAKKELRPDYMKGSTFGIPNFPRVPILDDYGREYWLDLTYIFPWGDIAQSGGVGPILGSLRPLSHPFTNEMIQQGANYDPFWKEPIVKDSETAGKGFLGALGTEAGERAGHAARTFLPTPMIDATKLYSAATGNPDYRGREKGMGTALVDAALGLKMTPVDYGDQMRKFDALNDPRHGRMAREINARKRDDITRYWIEKNKGRSGEKYLKNIEGYDEQLKGLHGMMVKRHGYYQQAQ